MDFTIPIVLLTFIPSIGAHGAALRSCSMHKERSTAMIGRQHCMLVAPGKLPPTDQGSSQARNHSIGYYYYC